MSLSMSVYTHLCRCQVSSLRRHKDEVQEITSGAECGILLGMPGEGGRDGRTEGGREGGRERALEWESGAECEILSLSLSRNLALSLSFRLTLSWVIHSLCCPFFYCTSLTFTFLSFTFTVLFFFTLTFLLLVFSFLSFTLLTHFLQFLLSLYLDTLLNILSPESFTAFEAGDELRCIKRQMTVRTSL